MDTDKEMTKGGTVVKALITGATSGIGREMAKILAVRGVDLIIASRDEKKMKSLASGCLWQCGR